MAACGPQDPREVQTSTQEPTLDNVHYARKHLPTPDDPLASSPSWAEMAFRSLLPRVNAGQRIFGQRTLTK